MRLAMAASLALGFAPVSFSHVVLGEPAALAGTSYRAALRVGHGCGESPTTAIRVWMPAGFRGAKPMPKPGWQLSITKVALDQAQAYGSHGRQVTEDVSEITWTATSQASWLPDAHFDEFVFRGSLAPVAGPMWFKVVQTCAKGSNQWVEVPEKGGNAHDLQWPAALLDVIESGSAAHQH
jgi:uncharacterized protein YcnI